MNVIRQVHEHIIQPVTHHELLLHCHDLQIAVYGEAPAVRLWCVAFMFTCLQCTLLEGTYHHCLLTLYAR